MQAERDDLPRFIRPLAPLIDLIARVPASVQVKLLVGFLGGAAVLLLVGMASAVMIGRNEPVYVYLTAAQIRLEAGLEMEHEFALRTENRALTLLTGDPTYGDNMAQSKLKIPAAKNGTARNMNTVAKLAAMAAMTAKGTR